MPQPYENLLSVPPAHAPLSWPWVLAVAGALLLWSLWAARGGREADRYPWLRWAYRSGLHPLLARWAVLAALAFILTSSLTGPLSAARNPGAVLLWMFWWPALAFLPYLAGRSFCAACPVLYVAPRLELLGGRGRTGPSRVSGLGMLPAAAVFCLFGTLAVLLQLEQRPWLAGRFLAAALLAALSVSWLLRGNAWCRHFCPVGALQALLSRLSALRWERSRIDPGPCPLELPSGAGDSRCCFCGDCRPVPPAAPALRFRPVLDPWRAGAALPGETLLVLLLLAHVIFEFAVRNDIAYSFILRFERDRLLWMPVGGLPGWLPRVPTAALLAALLAAAFLLVPLGREAVCWLFAKGEAPAGPGTRDGFGLSLLPLAAAAYAALRVPELLMVPEWGRRFAGLLSDRPWTGLSGLQAADYPELTIAALRLTLIAFGTFCAARSLRRRRAGLGAAGGPGVGGRFDGELAFAVLAAALLAVLSLLPSTQGDPC